MSDIFTQYVTMRQGGLSVEEVVVKLQPLANRLTRGDRQQLGKMVQVWETRNASRIKGIPPQAVPAVMPSTPAPAPFGTGFLNPSKLPGASPVPDEPKSQGDGPDTKACPKCGKANAMRDPYCYACGQNLESALATTQAIASIDPRRKEDKARFGDKSTLCLTIRNYPAPIEVQPRDEVILGRISSAHPLHPDVDLSPYGAERQGISRMHAAIKRIEHTLVITDLNSKNCTYLNGQRVYPHESRVVRDGDNITLGTLQIRVSFRE